MSGFTNVARFIILWSRLMLPNVQKRECWGDITILTGGNKMDHSDKKPENLEDGSENTNESEFSRRSFLTVASGLAIVACTSDLSIAGDKKKEEPKVSITPASAPKEEPVSADAKWQTVTIELTGEQKKQLEKLGVKTPNIKITTYDINRISETMN